MGFAAVEPVFSEAVDPSNISPEREDSAVITVWLCTSLSTTGALLISVITLDDENAAAKVNGVPFALFGLFLLGELTLLTSFWLLITKTSGLRRLLLSFLFLVLVALGVGTLTVALKEEEEELDEELVVESFALTTPWRKL